jgi:hypothetical protein
MNSVPAVTIADFEVHLLMTMKLRIKMSHKEAELEAKLAEHELSVASAERIHERVVDGLGDEAVYFANMKKLIKFAEQDATSLKYESVLWPGFTFKASADAHGRLESARYWHTRRDSPSVDSPDRPCHLEHGRYRIHRAIWADERWSKVVIVRRTPPRIRRVRI